LAEQITEVVVPEEVDNPQNDNEAFTQISEPIYVKLWN